MLETFHAQDPEQRAIRQLSNEKVDQFSIKELGWHPLLLCRRERATHRRIVSCTH